jgi:squalene/oxidosqualene cyclase-like protein
MVAHEIEKLDAALRAGFSYLQSLQRDDGSWHGDYDGPLFLTPGYIFACYATSTKIQDARVAELIAGILRAQNDDGGFGMHLEGESILFTTVLNYVALRLLGVPAEEPKCQRARWFIAREGGPLAVPSWGKYWLSILNLYKWDGVHPVPPELWLLPTWVPIHPSRLWCHARVVYLAVCWLYGRRFSIAVDDTIAALRRELYPLGFERADFANARSTVCQRDRYIEPKRVQTYLNVGLGWVERIMPGAMRQRALDRVLDHIVHEQETTNFIDLGPVNKAFDCIVTAVAMPGSEHSRRSIEVLHEYIFPCERGHAMQSYNSSQLWDTGFIAIALARSSLASQFREMAKAAYRFVDDNQVRENVDRHDAYFRDPSRGGWPFSTRAHGWPIADCTALGILAALELEGTGVIDTPIARDRLVDAVELLLFWQNDDGGWGTYERQRVGKALEMLNPSEIFSDIMVDISQTELTSSAISGLVKAKEHVLELKIEPALEQKMDAAIAKGLARLRALAREDGSWEGNWGICFTYGTWFGICGLRDAGVACDDAALRRAGDYLCSKQHADGGWGESYRSCTERQYVAHPQGSHAVMTAWALLALTRLEYERYRSAIDRAANFLQSSMLANGDWPQGPMTGVFNRTCMLNYRFYRNAFPLWALAQVRALRGENDSAR